MKTPTFAMLPSSEAVFLLRRELGPLCCWEDLLADQRTMKRETWRGLMVPHAIRIHGRPMGRVTAIKKFISSARAAGHFYSNPADLDIAHVRLAA